jgi:hypothetical protein
LALRAGASFFLDFFGNFLHQGRKLRLAGEAKKLENKLKLIAIAIAVKTNIK